MNGTGNGSDTRNVVLVGMPGAGKSTVGVLLAKQTARDFVDTDVLIQVDQDRSLQAIVDREGYLALRRIEERVLLSLDCRRHVVATGGSAVYSEKAMRHLGAGGVTCWFATHAMFGFLMGYQHRRMVIGKDYPKKTDTETARADAA